MKSDDRFSKRKASLFKPIRLLAKVSSELQIDVLIKNSTIYLQLDSREDRQLFREHSKMRKPNARERVLRKVVYVKKEREIQAVIVRLQRRRLGSRIINRTTMMILLSNVKKLRGEAPIWRQETARSCRDGKPQTEKKNLVMRS